ncbi:hypothetical protein [Actinoplanes sp. HUAS TT8]|uniref:hypothetical protein n=1 Tax=Actinoplanes sp. HUAS TT8 TaxID=3447453 RepID=UPI003F51C92B
MSRHRWPAVVTGLSGCLLLVTMPALGQAGLPLIPAAGSDYYYGMPAAAIPLVIGPSVVAIVLGLCLLRWWPYLLVTAAVLSGAGSLTPLALVTGQFSHAFALIGVLACAQSLWRGGAPRWGAALTALALGSRVFPTALTGRGSNLGQYWTYLSFGLIAVATVTLLAFAWRVEAADRENADPVTAHQRRARAAVLAGAALLAVVPLSQVSRADVVDLLGLVSAQLSDRFVLVALAGAASLVVAAVIAAVAGPWSFGGAVTMAAAQAALATPLLLTFFALESDFVTRVVCVLAGIGAGVAATASRWPVPVAGALCAASAASLFIADVATGGAAERIGTQHRTVFAAVLLILVVAAVTAVAGAVTPVLAARRSLPAMVGPIAGLMASGLVEVLGATYLEADGQPADDYLNAAKHLPTSGILLLATGAAVGGLGVARHLSERWARRKRDEQIRLEAAEAERHRLARPIHDGVLQVLAMVQRDGDDPRLAELAGEQDVALRKLLREDDTRGY